MNQTPEKTKTRKPTIDDVARACGVSRMTVSYVLNDKAVLKPETRQKVFRAMEEMNYHPSAVARGLASKKVHTFGLLLPVFGSAEFVTNPYANGILQGILWQAEREGYNVTLVTSRWESASVSAPPLGDGRVDGMIVVAPPLYSDVVAGLAALHIPVVAIAAQPRQGVPVVDVDNQAGLRLATQHLLELGHQRMVYLAGNDDLASYQPRLAGFKSALADAGVTFAPEMIVASQFDGKLAFEQTRALLRRAQPPTAIIAGNDTIGVAVIDAARCAGLNVPRDLSVVGFDDAPAASLVTPNLSTIHQPLAEIGEKAIVLLVERTRKNGDSADNIHLLAPRFVVRESSGPPPNGGERRPHRAA